MLPYIAWISMDPMDPLWLIDDFPMKTDDFLMKTSIRRGVG